MSLVSLDSKRELLNRGTQDGATSYSTRPSHDLGGVERVWRDSQGGGMRRQLGDLTMLVRCTRVTKVRNKVQSQRVRWEEGRGCRPKCNCSVGCRRRVALLQRQTQI